MFRHEIGNIRSAKAANLRLEDDLAGFPLGRFRVIDQFNFSSLGNLSSEHWEELYSEDARCRTKMYTSDLPKLRAPDTRRSRRSRSNLSNSPQRECCGSLHQGEAMDRLEFFGARLKNTSQSTLPDDQIFQ